MAKSFFSSSWYRVAELKPRLHSYIQIERQQLRGELWYVLQDPAGQKFYRFTPAAYALIGLMDGQRTVAEIFARVNANSDATQSTQDEVIELLAQLCAANAVQCDVTPDIGLLLESRARQKQQQWHAQILNPLSWRLPLFDPEPMLERLLPLARFCFSRIGAYLWLTVVLSALVLGASHWQDLTNDITDRVLAPHNLLLLFLVFPWLKIVHELGHACAVKIYGGEVHEMGVLLLLFQPVPYVDASAAAAFRSKSQRMAVGAAGMASELFIAALALFLWLNVEPGLVRSLAYNIVFIAGVSTVLFNANPLMRYDGYFILSDYLELPNLHARSTSYLRLLGERYLFGAQALPDDVPPLMERIWLTAYPIASFVYRVFVYLAIASFIAGKFFFIGIIVAFAALGASVLLPAIKVLIHLCTTARLRGRRRRAVLLSAGGALVAIGALVALPLPLRTRAEGVISLSEQAQVRAGVDGFVEKLVAQPGARVKRGQLLIVCRDPQLAKQVKILEFRLEELQTRYAAQWLQDQRQAQVIKDEMAHVEERLAHARTRLADLQIRSQADGTFFVPHGESLAGRFVQQGAKLAYVLDFAALTARVVVPQTEVDLVRQRSRRIDVRLADRVDQPLAAKLRREVPAASEQLPSTALGNQGGGSVAVDPTDSQGTKAVQKIFQFELDLPSVGDLRTLGGRVYVRFDHGWEPLALRWLRQLRQLFLGKFDG